MNKKLEIGQIFNTVGTSDIFIYGGTEWCQRYGTLEYVHVNMSDIEVLKEEVARLIHRL